MAHRFPLAVLVVVLAVGSPSAQTSEAERELAAEASERLHRHAKQWYDVGFYDRAWRLWSELIAEYDADYEAARTALGHSKLGEVWRPGEGESYPREDTAPPSREGGLAKKFQSLAKWLGKRHMELAQALAEAGEDERARYHYRRVLRFTPADARAGEALGYRQFRGVYVDSTEIALLRRSRQMRQVIDFLRREEFETWVVEGQKNELLSQAGIIHRAVATDNFTIWGDLDVALLTRAAVAAERAMWFCRAAFDGERGFGSEPRASGEFAFLQHRPQWEQLIRKNEDLFDADYVPFLIENCSAAYLQQAGTTLYAVWEFEPPYVLDQVVRTVAMDLAGLRAPALKEGIGHTVASLFFGRNLIFLLDQRPASPTDRERTSSRAADRAVPPEVMVPDLEAWARMGMREAWRHRVAPAELPKITADQFDNAQRVTAWAFCDYLLRRDPALLRALDDAGGGADNQHLVTAAFDSRADVELGRLDSEWRRLWTEDTRLLPMLVKPRLRPTALDKRATAWMDQINRARIAAGRAPTGWLQADFAAKAFVSAVRRGSANALSGAAGAYARDAMIAAAAKPEHGVARWLRQPAGRHLLLRPHAGLFDYTEAGRNVAFHVAPRRSGADLRGLPTSYPAVDSEDVPVSVATADVDARVRARVAVGRATIGYPISLHFFAGPPTELSDVDCLVRCNDEKVDGVVVVGNEDDGTPEGLVAFYPERPFPAGAEVTVSWSWTRDGRRQRSKSAFTTAR